MKKRRWILSLTIIAFLSVISLTAAFGVKGLITLPSVGNHFTKEKRKYTLTINTMDGGSVNTVGGEYEEGDLVNLTATPDEGYIFYGWYDNKNTYLTTSSSYSLVMNEDTTLQAKFGETPQDMSGNQDYFTYLRDCRNDFSFTVQCDEENAEEYLQNNLIITYEDLIDTEFLGMEGTYIPFKVEKQEDGQFLIKPTTQYDAGMTFVAMMKDQSSSGDSMTPDDGSGSGSDSSESLDSSDSSDSSDFSDSSNSSVGSSVIFLDAQDGGDSLTFTIEQENTEVLEVSEGIIFIPFEDLALIVDDGLAEGDEGDEPDYLICNNLYGMHEESIICIYDETDEEGQPVVDMSSIYGKVISIAEDNGTYTVVYGTPDISEIFENLDISYEEEIDLENYGVEISEDVVEEIKYELYSNENIQEYIATIEQVMLDKYQNSEYEMELLSAQNFLDVVDIKVVSKISGKTATIGITVSFNIPLNKKGSPQKAQLSFQLNVQKTVNISAYFNYKLKYWWFIPTGLQSYDIGACIETQDSISFGVYLAYDAGSAGLDELDKHFDKEAIRRDCIEAFNESGSVLTSNHIKDIFKANGYSNGSRRNISLFRLTNYIGVVSVNIDVKFFIDLDISGSLYYTSTSTYNTLTGVRSGYGNYTQSSSSLSTSDVVMAGSLGVKSGICAEYYYSIIGLSKYMQVGVGVEVGGYVEAEGYVSLSTGHHAGMIELGVYADRYAYGKLFSLRFQHYYEKEKQPLARFGYTQSLLSYVYEDEINQEEIALVTQEKENLSLLDLEKLSVWVYKVGDGIEKERLSSCLGKCSINVTFVDGTYLYYENGILKIRENAPVYFKDRIRISVQSDNIWQVLQKEAVNSYLDSIEIEFVYGDEDLYYEQNDNATEAEFRNLFRNYNDANATVLRSSFRHLLGQNLVANSDTISKYENLINEYMDQLFAVIKDYKQKENGDHTQENRFVYTEANAYNEMIQFLNKVVAEKNLTEDQAFNFILVVEDSEVLRRVVDDVTEQGNTEIAEQLSPSEDVKDTINAALERYQRESSDPIYAKEFSDKVKKFFALE